MIKTLNILVVEGLYLRIIKAILRKLITNIILHGEKLRSLPLVSEKVKNVHCHNSYSI
jgi:hypothetical protein